MEHYAEISNACDMGFGMAGRSGVGGLENKTGLGESMDRRLEGVRSLQVPPRAPKRQSKGCLFFCQSIVAKSHKTPVFPEKRNHRGIFRSLYAIRIHLQPFLPISVVPVAQPSPRT